MVSTTSFDISNAPSISHLDGSNRTKERNRKKKLRKKAASKRRRVDKGKITAFPTNGGGDYSSNDDNMSECSDPDEDTERIINFELKGPFERFKLPEDPSDQTPVKVASHMDINMKARTAALFAEEAAVNEAAKQRRSGQGESGVDANRRGRTPQESDRQYVKGEANVPPIEVLSKKKLKRMNRPSVASLKQMVPRPDVVEMWDVCARDPLLLTHLKSYRNTVPVPRHWCAKRKYLQGKRGFEKPPFQLPDFIARTGVIEMRQTVQDKDSEKTLKTKMREKIRPKVGKVDIDYHKLHDAFFKHQTKPKISIHGDLYYEGKEFEIKLKEKKPGNLSEDLRTALGLPSGMGAERYPTPWLIAMQRYGPPPSYPNLKIPGLNAPIPDGCAFGYHPGGWGKPPVDELGRPVYGDVFGNGGNIAGVPPPPPPPSSMEEADEQIAQGTVSLWGELEESDEEESDGGDDMDTDEEEDDNDAMETSGVVDAGQKVLATVTSAARVASDQQKFIDAGGLVTPAAAGGLITPSGVASVGLETPQGVSSSTIELRKKTIEEAMEDSTGLVTPSAQLYRVLPEFEQSSLAGGGLMASTKLYDVSNVTGAPRGIEADDPRLLRKRPLAGTESQQGMVSGLKSGDGSVIIPGSNEPIVQQLSISSKKYKEFKF